ncbi:MAG: CoA-binding protein [Gammaproteobacteria bacterium TMED225]|nr:MAG: CoA-binding protein [Gammaproteobacteria bacterium TMED225]
MNKDFLRSILIDVKTIALIGASSNSSRDSYKVMKFLIDRGYKVFPVNPNEANSFILGQKCYSNLKSIKEKIDMVDIFRAKEFIFDITREAIELKVKIIWTQENLIDEKAAKLGTDAGLTVIMDECPKKILEN